jgi:hypothetical protein
MKTTNFNRFKVFSQIVCCLSLTLSLGYAKTSLHQLETTRLKSTAGAGAGSILLEEATVLNPAAMAFYQSSSLYFQKSGMDIEAENDPYKRTSKDSGSTSFIVTDAKGGVKGSLAYYQQTEGFNEQKQISLGMAMPTGKASALGVSFSHRMLTLSDDGASQVEQKFNQFNFGASHVVSKNVSLGLVVIDPLKKTKNETKAIVGMQYSFENFISLITDIGADYNEDPAESLLYRAALQFRIFEDFFLRFGTFRDYDKEETGSGMGLSWVQPKLSVDLAMKNSKTEKNIEKEIEAEKFKETSFSLSYRF